jgi:hypothetical protein
VLFRSKDLRKAENDSVLQYVENSQQVIDLHRQMQECDGVLARMQEMLLGFQADLSGISEEIKHLQDESLSMSIRLKNRRAAEEKLHKFLENSSLSPELATSIVGPDVTEQFLDAVRETALVCETWDTTTIRASVGNLLVSKLVQ